MTDDDPREASRERWSRAAGGWTARRGEFQRFVAPVSEWLVDAITPQPGHRVLELAAGLGDTGFLAAELIRPGGELICSDFAEPMLEAAEERAQELGLDNVTFKPIDGEWIDESAATLDGVLCRFGYMLMLDPGAALRETRRVLKPGGRVALAAWAAAEHNPWGALPFRELVARELVEPPPPDGPGMFAFSPPGRIEGLLDEAGFGEHRVETLELVFAYDDLDHVWATTMDFSQPFAQGMARIGADGRAEVREALSEALAPWTGPSGELPLPARVMVAVAEA